MPSFKGAIVQCVSACGGGGHVHASTYRSETALGAILSNVAFFLWLGVH